MMLEKQELNRYSRHLLMSNFGESGQIKLKKAKVLVVGCGGLGSPVLLYLTAAGIGQIGIVEDDTVSLSNLQRQILFDENNIGQPKLTTSVEKLKKLNSNINFIPFDERLTPKNALEIIKNFDLVIDASDNFPTRYLINDACELLQKPFVYGAIHQFEGQVAVFNYKGSATYRDLFPEPPSPEMAPNCSEAGVLGVLPGIIGSMQANEAIKLITSIGEPLINKLFVIDTLSMISRVIKIKKNIERTPITDLIDYDFFCGLTTNNQREVTQEELLIWDSQDIDYQLIDVRSESEYSLKNINGLNIPLSILEENIDKINQKGRVVVHCQTGVRSQKAIEIIENKLGSLQVYNLRKPQF